MKYWQPINNLSYIHSVSYTKLLIKLLVFFAVFLVAQPTLAEEQCVADGGEENIEEYVEGPAASYALEQPIGTKTSVESIGEYTNLVYQFALGIVGIMAVVLIMFGGIRWISAAGNEQTISDAKEIIVAAVIGLVIALLSYSILVFINPRFTNLDLAVIKIPVQTQCGFTVPTMVAIEDRDGLKSQGKSICVGAANELYEIVDRMRAEAEAEAETSSTPSCPTCTIVVNSGYRSSESQAQLRECYEKAVSELNVKDGSQCTADCASIGCNPANKPCCSRHEKGEALDLVLTGFPESEGLPSSEGYAKASYNGGGGVAGLAANQEFLKTVMTSGDFKPISNEWWHFNYEGSCENRSCAVRTTADGFSTPAGNSYCVAKNSDGVEIYRHANCGGGEPSCIQNYGGYTWTLVTPGSCESPSYYSFLGQSQATTPSQTYLETPYCEDPTASCPFISVMDEFGNYQIDNNILPQSEDEPGNQVVSDLHILRNEPQKDIDGIFRLQISEWEQEHSYIDHIALLRLPVIDGIEYATTIDNKILRYVPIHAITSCESNGYDCTDQLQSIDQHILSKQPGDTIELEFKGVQDTNQLALLLNAAGRDRAIIQPTVSTSWIQSIINKVVPPALGIMSMEKSIHVEIKDQSGNWQKVKILHPRELPANSEVLDLGSLDLTSDTLNVRLTWTGYHSLDSVQLVQVESLTQQPEQLTLTSATHNSDGDVMNLINETDEQYAELIPNEEINLGFIDNVQQDNNQDYIYVLKSTGYYYSLY